MNPKEDTLAQRYGEIVPGKGGKTMVRYNPKQLYEQGKLDLDEAKSIPTFWATKPNPNEYMAAEDLYKKIARRMGHEPAEAQAAAWSGAGDMTGLGTVGTHTFPELMNERIMFTAKMRGEAPEKVLRDFIRGNKPLLSDSGRVAASKAIARHAKDREDDREFGALDSVH
jgi:hypothetical protein